RRVGGGGEKSEGEGRERKDFSRKISDLLLELNCFICQGLFTDPVILDCGHNFCQVCIQNFWAGEKQSLCPECGESLPDRKVRSNRALAKLSNKTRTLNLGVRKQENKLLCEEHQEELKLYCETDRKLMCVICLVGKDGEPHKSHNFMLKSQAIEFYKVNVHLHLGESCRVVVRAKLSRSLHDCWRGRRCARRLSPTHAMHRHYTLRYISVRRFNAVIRRCVKMQGLL
uniref:Uncharacterized protein n=1 Tax=Callorhinchus milii TaxID=7868 RepID=A0A4W3GSI4_CALMI